jgi:glycosyltransferase involved in cell wall biosynthesis
MNNLLEIDSSYKPLLSVLMTAYNRQEFISEAIESVLLSTYENFELIIVDDCSNDSTVSIIQSAVEKDNRIRFYLNEQNLGDYPNRNRAASFAQGELLVYVDSDDTINSDALGYIVDSFNNFPNASYATIYRGENKLIASLIESNDIIEKHFFKESILHFGPGGTVIRKRFFDKIGGFPEKYGPANDMYYNIKAASNTAVILMPYDYLNYRIHSGQESNNEYSYLYQGNNYFRDILQLSELPINDVQRNFLLRKSKKRFLVNWIRYFVKTKKIKKSIDLFKLANFGVKDFFEGLIA